MESPTIQASATCITCVSLSSGISTPSSLPARIITATVAATQNRRDSNSDLSLLLCVDVILLASHNFGFFAMCARPRIGTPCSCGPVVASVAVSRAPWCGSRTSRSDTQGHLSLSRTHTALPVCYPPAIPGTGTQCCCGPVRHHWASAPDRTGTGNASACTEA